MLATPATGRTNMTKQRSAPIAQGEKTIMKCIAFILALSSATLAPQSARGFNVPPGFPKPITPAPVSRTLSGCTVWRTSLQAEARKVKKLEHQLQQAQLTKITRIRK
jgi:hypothetical protein